MATLAESAEEARRAVLAIGAQTGDAGVKAYKDAQDANAALQRDALARASAYSSQIGGPEGYSVTHFVTDPLARYSSALSGQQAAFETARSTNEQATLNHLSTLGGLQPMLDAWVAAHRASAAGSGGSGSSGGPADLKATDLFGAAAAARTQALGTQSNTLTQAVGTARTARLSRAQNRRQLRHELAKARAFGDNNLAASGIIPNANRRGAKGSGIGAEIRRLKGLRGQGATPTASPGTSTSPTATRPASATINAQIERLRGIRSGLNERKDLTAQFAQARGGARNAYADLVGTAQTPLADAARQIGVNAGLSPEEVYALITPEKERTSRNADVANFKAAGGVLGVTGKAPPRAPLVRVKVPKGLQKDYTPSAYAQFMRRDPSYKEAVGVAADQATKGVSLADLRAMMQGAVDRNKKKRADGTYPRIYSQKLIDLVLADLEPAFPSYGQR